MKSIWKRFQYYGIGLSIGLLFTFIFFQNRGCSWLPENRVKNAILDNVIVFKTSDVEEMQTIGLEPADYIEILNKGDIKFGLSKREGEPKYYVGKIKTKDGKEIHAQFELRVDGFISLCTPLKNTKVITEDLLVGEAVFKRLPMDTALVSFGELARCQAKKLNISEKNILDALTEGGVVNYDLSDFKSFDRPVYHLSFIIGDKTYSGKAKWYKTRIYFTYIFGSGIKKC